MTELHTAPTTSERAELVTAVAAALSAVLERDVSDAREETALFHELGLDSTGVLDLLMLLEERLDLELDTDNLEMKHFSTVGSLADFLASETVN